MDKDNVGFADPIQDSVRFDRSPTEPEEVETFIYQSLWSRRETSSPQGTQETQEKGTDLLVLNTSLTRGTTRKLKTR